MKIENILAINNIDEIADLELADRIEREKINEMQKDIIVAMDAVYRSELFDKKYLDHVVLIARDNYLRKYKFTRDGGERVDENEYRIEDFMRGKRRDFVGIMPKDDFEIHMERVFEEKKVFEVAFFDNVITFEEFVTHEIAHNDFDIKYFERFGAYEEVDGITAVSEEYEVTIKKIISPLIGRRLPEIDTEKFAFKRQQIAEIYALLYQREFCRRCGVNMETHQKMDKKVLHFFSNPTAMLQKFNEEHEREFTLEDHVYKENHVLSLAVANLVEKQFPNWQDRVNIF